MKILVTGGSSLLGRTVADQLVERGNDVRCFQRRSSGSRALDVLGDVRDPQSVHAAAVGADAIVHLAALVVPKAPWSEMVAVNIEGTENVLSAAGDCGRLVYISTPSVAFHNVPSVCSEAMAAEYNGRDGYARSKAIAETIVQASTMSTVILRPHLVWGPGDTQLVERIIARARSGRMVLPDGGRALIDSTYVDDAAAAIVAAVDHCGQGDEATLRPLVVSGGEPRPVGDLVASILDAAGVDQKVRTMPAPMAALIGRVLDRVWRGSEPPLTEFAARQLSVAHWFDQRETRRILGWSPAVGLDEGFLRLKASFR